MNQESFETSIRKFLKTVGVNSQREIERAVAGALAEGRLTGTETLSARMTLEIAGLQFQVGFEGEIRLE